MAARRACRLSGLALAAGALLAATGRIAVLSSSSAEAYREAVEGLKAGLGERAEFVLIVELGDEKQRQVAMRTLQEVAPDVVVAVGSEATQALRGQGTPAPVISTMVLGKAGQTLGGRIAGAVTLDMPPGLVLRIVGKVFPQSRRLGALWNPARGAEGLSELTAEASRAGFVLRVAEAPDPSRLLAALDSLDGNADLVWCLPDETLYTPTTVKPLVLASLRKRLPLIGFSAAFARAGAAIGIYPDFREVGVQTAEMVRRYLEGQSRPGSEGPRKLKAVVNPKVVRLLGLRAVAPEQGSGSVVELVP
jgi:ABC-type uncharacterized transport system substrate-binding protein